MVEGKDQVLKVILWPTHIRMYELISLDIKLSNKNFFWRQKLECWIKTVPIYFLSVKKYTLGAKTNQALGWKDRKRYSKQIERRKQEGGAILMCNKVNFEQN